MKTCSRCQTEFSCVGSDTDRRYCSNDCRLADMMDSRRRICPECDRPFLADSGRQRYCGVTCRNVMRSRLAHGRAKGEHAKARKIEMKRALGRCQRCGYDEVPEVLELHHRDRDRKNNELTNLELLCPTCHSVEHYHARDGQFANNLGRTDGAHSQGPQDPSSHEEAVRPPG